MKLKDNTIVTIFIIGMILIGLGAGLLTNLIAPVVSVIIGILMVGIALSLGYATRNDSSISSFNNNTIFSNRYRYNSVEYNRVSNIGEGMKLEDIKHPMQPIGLDEQGVARFKENKIVRFLLDAGPYDLNKLCMMPFSKEDYSHLMQLIGYSVSGFGELSTSSPEMVDKADKIVEELCNNTDDHGLHCTCRSCESG